MSAMRTLLPDWARLHPDLNTRQRTVAIAAITFGTLVSILSIIVIFALADLGRPSFLPWITWFLFGLGPIITALEEYSVDGEFSARQDSERSAAEEEAHVEADALPGRPTPPRLRLIRSPESTNDQPYDQEKDHAHHARTAI